MRVIMEADWEVEIGGDAPLLDTCWPGLIDLREHPDAVNSMPEVQQLPALGQILQILNRASSPVRTSKCDIWQLAEIDPLEFELPGEAGMVALACYIDLLKAESPPWLSHEETVEWSKSLCVRLQSCPLRGCRADLIVRTAICKGTLNGFGVTAYLSAAGADPNHARRQLSIALIAFADTVCGLAVPERTSKLQ